MKWVVGLIIFLVAEIYVLIRVVSAIGVLPGVLLLVAVSACGPWLVGRAGLGVWRRARQRLDEGEVPGRELIDGLLLLLAGVCITVPGFITDAIGILLLLPPIRELTRRFLSWRLVRRVSAMSRMAMRDSGGGGSVVARSHNRPDYLDRPSLPPPESADTDSDRRD